MRSLFLFALLLGGCTHLPLQPDRVSAGLQSRTGFTLGPQLPVGVDLQRSLSENEAVSIALCNNAAFLELLADLGIARAEVVQAGVIPNPTLSLFFPSGQKQLEFTTRLATEIIWLRPIRTKAAKLDYDRTAEALVQTGLNLIRDIKLLFVDLQAAERRLQLAEEGQLLSAKIENFAKARLAAGDASELEGNTAAVDTLQNQEVTTRARQDVEIARARLQHALGLGVRPTTLRVKGGSRLAPFPLDSAPLVKLALAARPDLRAAELNLEGAATRQGLAKAEIFALTVALDANQTPIRLETGPAIDVVLPILNQNQGGRARMDAQFEKAARGYTTVRDRIVLEVREAHLRCLQARQSYDTWQQRILPPLEQSIKQAEQAYEVGDAAFLLVLENTRRLTDARARAAAAEFELRRALAELERALGGQIHKSKAS